MNFRTQIALSKSEHQIDYDVRLVALGSCFAENIAEKFRYFNFQNLANPFGIIFNPISLGVTLNRIVKKNYFTASDVFFHHDLWHCFEVHSELSNPNKQVLLNTLNALIDTTFLALQKATTCLITFGTAWVYRDKETHKLVANCHKVPQGQFTKELLTITEIESSIQQSCALIHSINPNCTFVFTVSPVRHLKDGFVENQLSKAHLLAAVHHVIASSSLGDQGIYFPSYEILMDDLRDYRFYADDMLHPNQVAVDYIWTCFTTCFISEDCFPIMKEIEAIRKARSHRPFNAATAGHQKFLAGIENRIADLRSKYPELPLQF